MVAGAEAADGAHALGEGSDHEIDLRFEPRLVRQAAAVGTKHAKGMGFVAQQLEAVLLLHRDEIGKRRAVAQHRIDAFQNHQLAATIIAAAGEALVEIVCIIVAEAHQLGAGKRAAVINRAV